MRRFCLGLVCLLPMPVLADGKGQGCGGDAYSFAEVVPGQRDARQTGPIMVLPDTLCADLAGGPGTRIDSLNVIIDPRASAEERPQTGMPTPAPPSRGR